jgi:hypothetical protein
MGPRGRHQSPAGKGTAEEKMKAMKAAGIHVVQVAPAGHRGAWPRYGQKGKYAVRERTFSIIKPDA